MPELSKRGGFDFASAMGEGDPTAPGPKKTPPPGEKPVAKKRRSASKPKPPAESSAGAGPELDKYALASVQAAYDHNAGDAVALSLHYFDGGVKAALVELGRSRGDNLKSTVTAALREYLVRTGVRLE